jgi:hypothetical protein
VLLAGCGSEAPSDPRLRTIQLPSFTVRPGEEQILCWFVPPDGIERWVDRVDVAMSPGSHHLIVLRVPSRVGVPARGPAPCDPLDFDAMLPGAQGSQAALSLPPGVAFRLPPDSGLYFQAHYLNATGRPLVAGVTYRIHSIPASDVTSTAGSLFLSDTSLEVPPGNTTVSSTCAAPHDLSLLYLTAHMHERGVRFDASVAGRPVFTTTDWSEPGARVFAAPGLPVRSGDAIAWTCAYANPTGERFRFGPSAVSDEMCILSGIFYPAETGTFSCQR